MNIDINFSPHAENEFSPTALSNLVNDYIPIIRQHYLSMIMRKSMPKSENISRKFNELKIHCPGPFYTVVMSSIQSDTNIEHYEAIAFLLRTHIKNEILANDLQCYIFFDSDFNINCLIGSDEKNVSTLLGKILNSIKNHFQQSCDILFRSGIGRTVEGPYNIHYSYEEAELSCIYADNKRDAIVLYSDIKPQRKLELIYDRNIRIITQYLINKQTEKFEKCVHDVIGKIEEEHQFELTKRFSIKLMISLLDALEKIGVNILNYPILPQLLTRIYTAKEEKDILDNLHELIGLISDVDDHIDQTKDVINTAIAYIDENLSDPNLSLDLISQHTELSKSYFCMIFKKAMGQGFNNYVRNQRIEYAKLKLAGSSKKICDISKETGFRSSKYFSSIFKNATQLSPSDYRKKFKKL